MNKTKEELDALYQRGTEFDQQVGNCYLLYSHTLFNSVSILTQINELLYLQSQNVKKFDKEEYERLISLYKRSENTRNNVLGNEMASLTQALADKIKK